MTDGSETLLSATNSAFNIAIENGDHVAALEAVRWIYEARFGGSANTLLSPLEAYQDRSGLAQILRTSVFVAEMAPAAILLAADLLEGKNKGGRPNRPTQTLMRRYELIICVGEAFEQTGSLREAFEVVASAGKFGNGNAESVERLYRRAIADKNP